MFPGILLTLLLARMPGNGGKMKVEINPVEFVPYKIYVESKSEHKLIKSIINTSDHHAKNGLMLVVNKSQEMYPGALTCDFQI